VDWVETSGRGEVGKEGRKRNMLEKCIPVYANAKMIPVDTFL
jgi:hypothetical protein